MKKRLLAFILSGSMMLSLGLMPAYAEKEEFTETMSESVEITEEEPAEEEPAMEESAEEEPAMEEPAEEEPAEEELTEEEPAQEEPAEEEPAEEEPAEEEPAEEKPAEEEPAEEEPAEEEPAAEEPAEEEPAAEKQKDDTEEALAEERMLTAQKAEANGVTVGSFTVTGGSLETDYKYADNTLTILTGTALTISGTSTEDRIVVDSVDANTTINNLSITSTKEAAICVTNGAKLNLTLEGENKLKSSGDSAGLQLEEGASLTIDGTGALDAKGKVGIGGGYRGEVGNITINGGTVTATGSDSGAGIGSGYDDKVGNITINGGTVTATGSDSGAGIGGGYSSEVGNVTISGGTVIAKGGANGAGIGGGKSGNVGDILISGGIVTAEGVSGAGIGGGAHIGGETVTISGGIVTAKSNDGAGIGSGCLQGGGTVTISGGTVKAESNYGIGIGGDYDRGGGTVTINGGTITATGGNRGAGIGGGKAGEGGTVTIDGGNINASSIKGTLQNSKGQPVKPINVLITNEAENAPIKSIELKNAYDYNVKDVKLIDNRLCIYLPKDNALKSVEINETYYNDYFEDALPNSKNNYTFKLPRTLSIPTIKSKSSEEVRLNEVTPSAGAGTVQYGCSMEDSPKQCASWGDGDIVGFVSGKTYYIFAKVTGDDDYIDVYSSALEIRKEETPNISIDGLKLKGFLGTNKYKINNNLVSPKDGILDINEEWCGTDITIKTLARGENWLASDVQTLEIPSKPAAPTSFEFDVTHYSITAKTDSDDYEFSLDNEAWQDEKSFKGLDPNNTYTVHIRKKATETSFASESVSQTITTAKAPISSIDIAVTAPEAGADPKSIIPDTDEYTATIKWNNRYGHELHGNFYFYEEYTAIITVRPKKNYTFNNAETTVMEGWTKTSDGENLILSKEFPPTRKEKITSVTPPTNTALEDYYTSADEAIVELSETMQIETETGSSELTLTWSCSDYNTTPSAENTFSWVAEHDDFEPDGNAVLGTITVTNKAATAVTITPVTTENIVKRTYGAAQYDVKNLFEIDENAGVAIYELLTSGTGEGELMNGLLSVTKAGEFKIKVTTAAQGIYAAGEATNTLTISQKAPTAEDFVFDAPKDAVYKKEGIPAKVSVKDGISGMGKIRVKYARKTGENSYEATSSKAPKNAGTYKVLIDVTEGDNYLSASNIAVGEFEITKAPVTVTANDISITYGEMPEFNDVSMNDVTIEGLYEGDTLSGTPTFTCSYQQYDDYGIWQNAITPSGLSSNNYKIISYREGNLWVYAKEILFVWHDPESLVYCGEELAPTVEVTGTVNNDKVSAKIERTEGDGVSVGTHSFKVNKLLLLGEKARNYKLPKDCSHSFEITGAEPTITLEDKKAPYTGKVIEIDPAAVMLLGEEITGAGIEYTYYTDESCTDAFKTNEENGAESIGAAPSKTGEYYVIATVLANGNYSELRSEPCKLTIYVPIISDEASSELIIDGKPQKIGKTEIEGNCTTVMAEQDKLNEFLETAHESLVIPIEAKTERTKAALVLENIEDMAERKIELTVKTPEVSCNIPAGSVDTDAVLNVLAAPNSHDVPIELTIGKLSEESIHLQDGELVMEPFEFVFTASYNGKTVEIDSFNSYVERIIEIPSDIDISKITTAVVVENNTERHVPTELFEQNGKWYAKINSRTNSKYALVNCECSFCDAKGKWYQAVVNEMGEREIIHGRAENYFCGENSITRAEFAQIIVNALGLPSDGKASFGDVDSNEWYAGAVGKAYQYGLINGRGNGEFCPNANITREEAMIIIRRAAEITGVKDACADISSFDDFEAVSEWAHEAVGFNVANGLILGSDGELNPKADISRAETATVVLRLLQKSNLIDIKTIA